MFLICDLLVYFQLNCEITYLDFSFAENVSFLDKIYEITLIKELKL